PVAEASVSFHHSLRGRGDRRFQRGGSHQGPEFGDPVRGPAGQRPPTQSHPSNRANRHAATAHCRTGPHPPPTERSEGSQGDRQAACGQERQGRNRRPYAKGWQERKRRGQETIVIEWSFPTRRALRMGNAILLSHFNELKNAVKSATCSGVRSRKSSSGISDFCCGASTSTSAAGTSISLAFSSFKTTLIVSLDTSSPVNTWPFFVSMRYVTYFGSISFDGSRMFSRILARSY